MSYNRTVRIVVREAICGGPMINQTPTGQFDLMCDQGCAFGVKLRSGISPADLASPCESTWPTWPNGKTSKRYRTGMFANLAMFASVFL